jgi:ribosomal protein L11 methylase PrmA
MLPLRKRLSWNVLSQVTLQAKLERDALNSPESAISKVKSKKTFTKMAYRGFLSQLRNWIAKLQPANSARTVWGEYARTHTYSDDGVVAKKRFIANFASDVKPKILFDLGCNTGDYSLAALEGGAEYVVGFDFDQRAIDLAYSRSLEGKLAFLPLWFDAANPSPDQGWKQTERQGFHHRAKADALIALAFEHHLAIAKNVPMAQVLDWLVGAAPQGVIEFVPKTDSTIVKMLALREDIFTDYSEGRFVELLEERANIVCSERISESGRTLFRYSRP